MEVSPDIAVALVAIAPILAAVLAPMVQRLFGSWSGWVLAVVPAVLFVYLWGFVDQVAAGGTIAVSLPWAPVYGFDFSFFIDGLSLTFALTISGIGAFILIYSGAYLKGHPHQGRFLAFLLLFMGAMLGLVLADSVIVLYTFWELTTVASFLLIGFDHSRQLARRAAIQALVVTGLGGLALLAGVVLLQRLTGSWELSGMLASGPEVIAHAAYVPVLVLVLLAAFTKSAQVPFHFWLPNAMEAPTPVSAFLHSATMVQGGVYLLARLSPVLGGTDPWMLSLVGFGSVTLLWGSVAALRQTDLKQMLAQTTIASLGLLILLIGIGTKLALIAAILYFLGHALYKAALFLVAGIIDHEAGTRDITALGGLRDHLTITFLISVLAAASMIGLPPLVSYLAKEEMYLALLDNGWQSLVVLAIMVIGNALLTVVALAVVIKPFMGQFVPVPKDPHEAPLAMLAGPLLFGGLGVLLGLLTGWLSGTVLAPTVSAIAGTPTADPHLALVVDPLTPVFWLSIATWGLGLLLFLRLDTIRTLLRRAQLAIGWTFDIGFDWLMFGLIRLAAGFTRLWHHGRLELYLVVLFAMLAVAMIVPLWTMDGLPDVPGIVDLTFYEWAVMALGVAGVLTLVIARTRLFAILALGVQGLAVALVFLLFGAPDLSFTQLMVEILSVVILALVMTRLRLDRQDPRELEDLLRDGGLAVVCGLGFTALLFAVLQGSFDPRLSDFFNAQSVPVAHGRNVVNVILVDFRGIDTLGEISVVMTAGIATLALIRSARRLLAPTPKTAPPQKSPRRRRTGAAKA
ncbi:MAG TPA: putative monovalent cation/H+ antiporter subunit A [Devosiaceae bacterium]|nr:putative monovalent cation/H+ antiporter subunit A [Devosiaceae bacterium]